MSQETKEKRKFFFDFRKLIDDILKRTKPLLVGLVVSAVDLSPYMLACTRLHLPTGNHQSPPKGTRVFYDRL